MIFNWADSDIQRNVVYFKFSFNDENWIFTSLNNNSTLINVTTNWHKTYFLKQTENSDVFNINTTILTCTVTKSKREINIENKDNA